jgi:hypothetical protein
MTRQRPNFLAQFIASADAPLEEKTRALDALDNIEYHMENDKGGGCGCLVDAILFGTIGALLGHFLW